MKQNSASDFFEIVKNSPEVLTLQGVLTTGVSHYYEIAGRVLKDSGIELKRRDDEVFPIDRNFFSFLFLYSYYKAGIDISHCEMYVTVNQALRGIVTGCDNILDDEYKCTIDTDLPENAKRFRSIIDLLVSDRVLFELFMQANKEGKLSSEQVSEAISLSLKALIPSGVQEASEEGHDVTWLSPDEILSQVHHYKTGLLFISPWKIPLLLEPHLTKASEPVQEALYAIGMGCQVFDDVMDIALDFNQGNHNYVASSIYQQCGEEGIRELESMIQDQGEVTPEVLFECFPDLKEAVCGKAMEYLENGLALLFGEEKAALKELSLSFLIRRIGVDGVVRPFQ